MEPTTPTPISEEAAVPTTAYAPSLVHSLASKIGLSEPDRWRRHAAILGPALLLLAFSGWQLAHDFVVELQGLQPSGVPVASAKNPLGDVKRRPSTRFRWLEVGADSPLYDLDSVRTTAGGGTQIVLKDGGGHVQLGENSLLVLAKSGGKTVLKLASGNASFQGGKAPVMIEAQGKVFEATDAQGQITAQGGQTQIQLATGTLLGKSGTTPVRISGSQSLQLSSEGAAHIDTAPPIALSPEASAQFVGDAPITFKWAGKASEIEVFRTDTGSLHSALKRAVNSGSTSFALEAGTYEWRLVSTSGTPSPSRRLSVIARNNPRLLSPSDHAQVTATPSGVLFSWNSPGYFDQQTLWISTDEEFGKEAQQIALTRESATFVPLNKAGTYYWKLEAKSATISGRSPVRSFKLLVPEVKPTPVAKAPEVKATPTETPSATPTPTPSASASAVATPAAPAVPVPTAKAPEPAPPVVASALPSIPAAKLAWVGPKPQAVVSVTTSGTDQPKAAVLVGLPASAQIPEVKLVLKRDNEVILDEKTSGPKSVDLVKPGKYTWSVTGPKGEKLVVAGATSGSFDVAAPFTAITLLPTEGDKLSNRIKGDELKKEVQIKLRWKPYSGAKGYTLKLASDIDMKNVFLERTLDKSEYVVTQKTLQGNAKFFYEVRAPLSSGFVAKSPIAALLFNFVPPMPVAPVDKAVIPLPSGKAAAHIILTWEKTNGTDGYAIEIARDAQFTRVIFKKDQPENFMILDSKKNNLSAGTYYWRVRGFSKPAYTDASETRQFTLR